MSKYNLSELLTEVEEERKKDPFQGTGRQGYYLNSYMLLMDKMDDLKAQDDIKVDEMGPSGDGKVPFEFRVYPVNSVPFAVYPYKFDPTDDPEVRDGKIFHFSVSGPVGSIDSAKKYLGDGVYSNQEYQEGLDQLASSGDTLEEKKDDMKKELPKSIKDKEERDAEIEARKNSGAFKGMMKEEEGFTEVNEKEVRFHLDAYRAGTIDGDDLAQAIEEIVFGDIVAPGMNEDESINEELAPTGIAISQKQLDNLKKLGAISGLEVYVQDKDGSNVRKVAYTLTNTDFEKGEEEYDYLEFRHENLKEHFGRFMKDYQ
jgi:hypothetical protein